MTLMISIYIVGYLLVGYFELLLLRDHEETQKEPPPSWLVMAIFWLWPLAVLIQIITIPSVIFDRMKSSKKESP